MKTYLKTLPFLLAIGLGAGFINGLLGAGGGILVVLGLRRLFANKVPNVHSFYATSIAVMLPLSAWSAWQYYSRGNLPTVPFTTFILPALLGGLAGALLLRKIRPRVINRLFAALVLMAGVFMVI